MDWRTSISGLLPGRVDTESWLASPGQSVEPVGRSSNEGSFGLSGEEPLLVPRSKTPYAVKVGDLGTHPIRPIGRSAGRNHSDEGGNEFVEVL